MPSTLTGLLVFVILLLPGFAYLVGRERVATSRKQSPFRETVTIVSASVSAELVVATILSPLWSQLINFDELVGSPEPYFRSHYAAMYWSLLLMLFLSAALAYAASTRGVREWFGVRTKSDKRLVKWLARLASGNYPHDSTVSGWWVVFEKWRKGRDIQVGCVLDDGTYLGGDLGSFSTAADESNDRELVLIAPIMYRPAGDVEAQPYPCGSVCIPAGRIQNIFVNYSASTTSLLAEAEEEGEGGLAEP